MKEHSPNKKNRSILWTCGPVVALWMLVSSVSGWILIQGRQLIMMTEIWTSNLPSVSYCWHVFEINMLTCSVKSIFYLCETGISTSLTVLCNCLTHSNYTVKNRVRVRSYTYVSHTSSYEVMFPWHRPLQSVGVFHHRTMTDEGERWGRGEAR